MATKYVVVAQTSSKEHAEKLLASLRESALSAELVEMEVGDALVRVSDAMEAVADLRARLVSDGPLVSRTR